MKFFHGSIRKKLVILVLLTTIPVFSVLLATELVNRKNAVKQAEKDAAIILNGLAEVQQRITDSTRTLLRTLASMPEIRDANVQRSRVILMTLLETNPIYTNVILVDLSGNVVAAGKNHDQTKAFNFSDRKQFKEAIASKGFASGEFVVGKSSQKAIFPFGMAVLDEHNDPVGAIIIGVSLNHYSELLKRGKYAENTLFGLCDQNGIRLFRYPFSKKGTIGKPIKEEVFNAARKAASGGSLIALTTEGLKRVVVFEPLRLRDYDPPYMYMFMGIEYAQVQAGANAILNRLAITSLSSLLMALAIAWFIGSYGIVRRIEKLTLITKQFGQGDENVTSDIDYSDGEIGALAQSFDNMALAIKSQKQKIVASETSLRTIIETIPDLVWLKDQNGVYLDCNTMFERFFGAKKEVIIGKTDYDFVDRELADFFRQHDRKAMEVGAPSSNEEWITFADDGRHALLDTIKTPMLDTAGKLVGVLGIGRDITSRKLIEEENAKLQTQLIQAQKMEAVGTLAGGIAHDFNNILSVILGYSEMAIEDAPPGTKYQKDLDKVLTAAVRARELVKQILAFSRQTKIERHPLRIQPLIMEGLKMLRSSIPTTISIVEDIDAESGVILADPTQIHQILMNLCTNAYQAMEAKAIGGILKVSLQTNLIDSGDQKTLLHINPGEYVELIVADTGVGLHPDIIGKIFDPYFTTKESGKGTGMGLAIIHGIMKDYGGTITVESQLGKGTAFHVYFPVLQSDIEVETTISEDLPKGHERILFIDDEELLADMGKDMLERLGYHVTVQRSSVEALKTFQNTPHEYDMVITDQTMPDMTGAALACQMMQIRPDIPIILCTGYSNLIDEQSAKALGIKQFVLKPLTKEIFAKVVRNVLDKN